MSNPLRHLVLAALVCAALLGFAFYAAPHSCEWGWDGYTAAGLAAAVVLAVLPFFLLARFSAWKRVLGSAGFAFLGAGIWVAGIFAANFRIVCRLI